MARHSFVQMSKLPGVCGRISYITSEEKQENLYATYQTADNQFWSNLARESQQEFKRSGTEGKCIEARELIIALPESYTEYDPKKVLEDFTDRFHERYGAECVSALHHNKSKTNYHIHLVFSERKLLPAPEVKVASRSVYYDERGKRVRTKKEITGNDGKIRKGCKVIAKGEVYESHMFSAKDVRYKSESFLQEVKRFYTDLINRHVSDPEKHLKVFDKNSVYLPTRKVGKSHPRKEDILADNSARQDWNRTADIALVTGIPEAKILEVKRAEIHDKVRSSIKERGWMPNLFRNIVSKAKDFLQNLVRQKDMPQKPTISIDISEFRTMQQLMIQVQGRTKEIRNLQENVLPKLKEQLKDATGIFKGSERKAITEKIQQTEKDISGKLDALPNIVKDKGYTDVSAFMKTYREMEKVVDSYERDVLEYNQKLEQKERPAVKPPEISSVREMMQQMQEQRKQQQGNQSQGNPPQKDKPFDRDSR